MGKEAVIDVLEDEEQEEELWEENEVTEEDVELLLRESEEEKEFEAGEFDSMDAEKHFMRDLRKGKLLTKEEEVELFRQYHEKGDMQSREKLIISNIRLVISIAKKYKDRGIPFSDLIEEGTIGLITAIDRFRLEMGNRLSVYAVPWIRQAVGRYVATQSRVVHIPVYLHDFIMRIWKIEHDPACVSSGGIAREALAQQMLGEDIEKKEAKDGAQVSKRDETAMLEVLRNRIERARFFMYRTAFISTEETYEGDDGEGDTFGERKLTNLSADPEQCAMLNEVITQIIPEVLSVLTPSERRLIERRFGLSGRDAETLDEIATTRGFTRERARQLQAKALGKMRRYLKRKQAEALRRSLAKISNT